MQKFFTHIIFASVLLIYSSAFASVITIWGDTADSEIHATGAFTDDPSSNGSVVGVNGGFDYSNVYVFQLPTLTSGQTISTADFSFYDSASSSEYNVDLYGLAYRAAPKVLVSDWYSGPDDTANTLIQSAIIPPSYSFSGRITTDTAGNTALTSYLNAQYAAGAVGGDYAFLRLSSSAANGANTQVDFVDNADLAYYLAAHGFVLSDAQNTYSPKLDVTIAPEPSIMMMGLAIGGISALRRHSRRS